MVFIGGLLALGLVGRFAGAREQAAAGAAGPPMPPAAASAPALSTATPLALATSCQSVSDGLVAAISTGLKGGTHLSSMQAVSSPEHEQAWYVSGWLDGPGLPAHSAVATWATNRLDGSGSIFAVGGYATQFSDWADGGRTTGGFSRSDAAAQASIGCVQGR